VCAGIFAFSIPIAEAQDSVSARVGFLIPRDGPHNREAKSLADGFELFLKETGQSSVEILRKDLAPDDANIAELLADLLIKRQVQFLIGPPTLEGSEKCIHGVTGSTAVLFVTHPSVRLVAGELCQNNSFRLLPNTYQSAQPLASWALKNLGRKVFITGQDDSQGNEEADFFAYGFDRVGGSFVDRIMFSENSIKMKSLAESIVKAKPDLVFAAFRHRNAVDFVKTMRTMSVPLLEKTIGPESLQPSTDSIQSQAKNFLGVRTLTWLKHPTELAGRVKKTFGRELFSISSAAEGYDIAQVVCKAVMNSPKVLSDQSELCRFIEDVEIDGPRGKITFDKNHEPIIEAYVQEISASNRSYSYNIVSELGKVASLDFGCGKVGFPKKPELDLKPEDDVWSEGSE